jgi:Tfp pilus assembly protein PilN
MQRIYLDYAKKRRPAGSAGWGLLVIGLLLLTLVMVWNYLKWQSPNATDQQHLHAMQTAVAQHQATAPKIDDARLLAGWTRAMSVSDELNRPWENLFVTLESAPETSVGLLTLEPDVEKSELVLTAEAKNFNSMLAYYRQLQQQPIFSDLALHTHQINRQDQQNPIRFRITAKWMTKS